LSSKPIKVYEYSRKKDLLGADPIGTNFKGANLEQTNPRGANLEKANLKSAKLHLANFQEAKLEGANLQGANLKGAPHLTIDQLSKLKTLHDTKLDEEFLIPLKEKYPALFEEPNSNNQ